MYVLDHQHGSAPLAHRFDCIVCVNECVIYIIIMYFACTLCMIVLGQLVRFASSDSLVSYYLSPD